MENGINRVSPAEVNLVVYEADNMSDTLVNIWIIKKTFRLINVNACFKEVRENWKQVQHGSFGKLLFLVSSETFLSTIKRNIAPLMEQNKNNGNRNVLVVTEYNDVDDDEDDDDFELLDEEEHNVIKVNKLNDVEEWWPSVLQFFKPKDLSSGNVVRKREYDCFFLFNEDSRTEAEWFKKHKDRLESFGIRCLKRDRNSQITDDIYMKNSRCIVMYVNNRRQTDRIKENIRKATENGCSVRLFLQDAEIEFAKRVQADCQVNLSGTSLLAHWANLLKDLDIIDMKRAKDYTFYSRTEDNNFRTTYRQVSRGAITNRPVTSRQIVPVVTDIYSFEYRMKTDLFEDPKSCRCHII